MRKRVRESERDRERERETERNCARRQPDGLLPRGRALKPGEDKRQRERERKIAVLCCNPFVTTPCPTIPSDVEGRLWGEKCRTCSTFTPHPKPHEHRGGLQGRGGLTAPHAPGKKRERETDTERERETDTEREREKRMRARGRGVPLVAKGEEDRQKDGERERERDLLTAPSLWPSRLSGVHRPFPMAMQGCTSVAVATTTPESPAQGCRGCKPLPA